MRAAGLGTRAGKARAAEWLHADDRADHVAIDIGIADIRVLEDLAPERFERVCTPSVNPYSLSGSTGAPCLDVLGSIAHDVQYRPELLARELRGAAQFDQVRREKAALRACRSPADTPSIRASLRMRGT
jgi:hypothetical protein